MVDVNADLMQAIEELRSELRMLSERLAQVESTSAAPHKTAPVPVNPPAAAAAPAPTIAKEIAPPSDPEPISEETLLIISAAVAAFLGERAHIRQVRLISSGGWALQGRVFVQASHNLSR